MILGNKKRNFFLSKLTKFKVLDKNGVNLGSVGDALFQIDKNEIKFHSFILFGSLLEEKLEDAGLRENIDPIIPFENVVKEDIKNRKFTINLEKDEIKSTDNLWQPPNGTFQYLRMKKIPVCDKNGKKIGRIIDIYFQKNGKFKFILGGSKLEEFLERIRIFADRDLILPSNLITEFTHEHIKTSVAELDLKTTLEVDFSNFDKHDFKSELRADTSKLTYAPRGYTYEMK